MVNLDTHGKHQQDQSPKNKRERGVLTIATQNLGSLRAEKTETPAGSRPEERDFLQQAGAWIADDGCSKSRQPRIRKDRNTSRIKARRTRVFTPEGLPPSKRI